MRPVMNTTRNSVSRTGKLESQLSRADEPESAKLAFQKYLRTEGDSENDFESQVSTSAARLVPRAQSQIGGIHYRKQST